MLTFFLADYIKNLVPSLIGVAAGGFLYISLTDMLPEMHKENVWEKSLEQFVFMVIGIAAVYILGILLPRV